MVVNPMSPSSKPDTRSRRGTPPGPGIPKRRVAGDLEVFGIANLLQLLSSAESYGFLTISKESDSKVIHFTPDGIHLLRGVRLTNPLGEILVRIGILTRERLEIVLEDQRRSGKRLGDHVVDAGILTREALGSALREQVAEEIYDLFTWSDCAFEFVESGADPSTEDPGPLHEVVLDANVMSIMIEAAR